jgi:hypothetical protein
MALWQQLLATCFQSQLIKNENCSYQATCNNQGHKSTATTEHAIEDAPGIHMLLSERLSATCIKPNIWEAFPTHALVLAGCMPASVPQSPNSGIICQAAVAHHLPSCASSLRCLELRGQLLQIHRNVESWLCQTIDHRRDVLNQSFLHRLINVDTICR